MATETKATVADLYRIPTDVKAELVNEELVLMSSTGDLPSSASGIIYASLLAYARRTKTGRAYGDNTGFLVKLPHRGSFSPDAAFHTRHRTGMRFLEGAPVFALARFSRSRYRLLRPWWCPVVIEHIRINVGSIRPSDRATLDAHAAEYRWIGSDWLKDGAGRNIGRQINLPHFPSGKDHPNPVLLGGRD